jgi:hypothetical protein
MGLLREVRLGGVIAICSAVFLAVSDARAETAKADGGEQKSFAIRTGNHGQNCQRVRMLSGPYDAREGNDMVLYCPLDFPWITHCGTTGVEAAPLANTTFDDKSKCTASGPCNARKLRKNFGPQNQATEIVQRDVSSEFRVFGEDGTKQPEIVTGCWVYDLDHRHLPYATEIVCCR